jgi:hypothetical protein
MRLVAPETRVHSLRAPRHGAPAIEPPDIPAGIGRVVYPGCANAVVPFTAVMLGSQLMAAYPWSREHWWSAKN